MAYNAPELLLIGAAQNLVLGGSAVISLKEECQPTGEREDHDPFVYDLQALW